jgi:hypothetical protein
MSSPTEDLWALIRQFRSGTEREQQLAERALKVHSRAVVPLLIQEVEEELQRGLDRERLTGQSLEFDKQLNRLVHLLVGTGDSRGIPTLARLASTRTDPSGSWAAVLNQLLVSLTAKATREDAPVLLWLLEVSPPAQKINPLRVIVALAERDPIPELQRALTLVRPRFGELEKILLRRRLYKALWQSSLPIPATAFQSRESLPLPAKEVSVEVVDD